MAAGSRRLVGALVLTGFALLATAGAAPAADPQRSAADVVEFRPPVGLAKPGSIVEGPDGAMWFAAQAGYPRPGEASYPKWLIGRVTLAGKFTLFDLPLNSADGGVGALTAGPDGALWYLTREAIGRITTSGQVTEFPHERVAGLFESSRGAMEAGPDGNLWFVGATPGMVPAAAIDRITTTGQVTEIPFSTNDPYPQAIAWGPDLNLWFASRDGSVIGHVSSAGQFTEYAVAVQPNDLVFGPGDRPWFTSTEGVGSISLAGELSPIVPFPGGGRRIIAGPDGRLWFSSGTESVIGRVGPGRLTSKVGLPARHRSVFDLATGPGGTVWYTAEDVTPCEGGGGTCMAIDDSEPSMSIGRIEPAPRRTVIGAAGSSLSRGRAKLDLSCIDGPGEGACHGRIRLAFPHGPTIAQRRFRLASDATRTIVLRLDRRARRIVRAGGDGHLNAIAETQGGQVAGRELPVPGRSAPRS